MIIVIGEVLFDIFPDQRRLGGAPYNFAHHLKQLGLPVRFISRVGADEAGEEIRARVASAGLDPDDIQIDPARPTGWVRVSLDDQGVPEFEIIPDVAYDHLTIPASLLSDGGEQAEMIYFGTLIQRTPTAAAALMALLNRTPAGTCRFCDLNLRAKCWDAAAIDRSLACCDILKISDGECDTLRRHFDSTQRTDPFINGLMETFSITWVSLTRGEGGSTLYTRKGAFTAPAETHDPAGDTVGAGDGYAAMLAAGYRLGWRPNTTMDRAARFARAICDIQGAVPDDPAFYTRFLSWTEEGTHRDGDR